MKCRSKKNNNIVHSTRAVIILHSPCFTRTSRNLPKWGVICVLLGIPIRINHESVIMSVRSLRFSFGYVASVMRNHVFRKSFIFPPPFGLHKKKTQQLVLLFCFYCIECIHCAIYTIFNIVPGLTLPYTMDVGLHQKSITRSYTYNTHTSRRYTKSKWDNLRGMSNLHINRVISPRRCPTYVFRRTV